MESSIHVDDSGSEALREIVQKFRRLQAILINLSARADSARELAVDLEEKLNWFIAGPANPEKPRVPGFNRGWTPDEGIASANVARHLEAVRQRDDSWEFRIDFQEPLHLPRLVGHLLLFLAQGVPEPQDEIVGYRSKAEILDHLHSITSKTYRAQFVSQLVYQLRGKLGKKYGSLVEFNPQYGWRFDLRTGGAEHFVRTRLANGPGRRPRLPVAGRSAEAAPGEEVRSLSSSVRA